MSANPISALVAEFAAYASGRVFGYELPQREAAQMPRAALVFSPSGRVPSGGDNSYARIGRVRVDVRAYGADIHQAMALYLSVHDVLKALRPHVIETVDGDVLLDNATVSSGPFALRDPDTDWPFVLGVYGVHMHEQIISS